MGLPGTPAARLAKLILDWAADAKIKGSTGSFVMPLTHQEMAAMAATTHETVTRTLSRLRRKKVIATRGVAMTILDAGTLQHMASG